MVTGIGVAPPAGASSKESPPAARPPARHSPPFAKLLELDHANIAQRIRAAHPDILLVALGAPKQEKWIAAHVGRIHATALLGVGAAFDFHAGTKPRAPRWIQRSGFEWLFRLASEPRRLAHRYVIDNSIFIAHAVRQLMGWKSYAQDW